MKTNFHGQLKGEKPPPPSVDIIYSLFRHFSSFSSTQIPFTHPCLLSEKGPCLKALLFHLRLSFISFFSTGIVTISNYQRYKISDVDVVELVKSGAQTGRQHLCVPGSFNGAV